MKYTCVPVPLWQRYVNVINYTGLNGNVRNYFSFFLKIFVSMFRTKKISEELQSWNFLSLSPPLIRKILQRNFSRSSQDSILKKDQKYIFFITTYGMFLNKPYRKGFQTFLLSVLTQWEVNLWIGFIIYVCISFIFAYLIKQVLIRINTWNLFWKKKFYD